MAGQPTFSSAAAYGGNPAPPVTAANQGPTHMAFVMWVVLLGIVLPVAILGGLQVGGFKFVFKGR